MKPNFPPSVQQEFERWLLKTYYPEERSSLVKEVRIDEFYEMHFDFQSGVLTAYFRSVDIHITMREDIDYNGIDFLGRVNGIGAGKWTRDYNIALQTALTNAADGREQQLQNIS